MGIKQGSYTFFLNLRAMQRLLFRPPLIQQTKPPLKFFTVFGLDPATDEKLLDISPVVINFLLC